MKRMIAAFMAAAFAVTASLSIYAEDNVEIIDEAGLDAKASVAAELATEADIGDTEGFCVDEDTSFAYTDDADLMSEDETAVYFKQDFTQWDSSDLSNASTGIGTISKHKLQTDSINIAVSDGAMTMTAAGNTAEQGMLITPVSSISGKNVTFSFMLKKEAAINGSSTERSIYLLGTNDSGDGKYIITKMNSNGVLSRSTASTDASLRVGDSAFTAPKTDADGYYNISADFCIDQYNDVECWSAYLYDGNNSDQLFYEVHWPKDKFPNGLQGVWLMSYRDSGARANGAVAPVTIKAPTIETMVKRPALFVQSISHPGGQLEAGEKNIQISFNKAVDPDSFSGITFTKSDGTDVAGGIYISCGESANIVNIGFGRLDVGDYILRITSDLKTADGEPAAEKEYNYSVTSVEDTPYISHDFTRWSSGDLSNAELGIGEITQISEINEADCFDYFVEGDMLRMMPTGKSNVATVFLPNRDIEGKDTIFTFKMRADAVTCSGEGYRYIGLYNGLPGATARNVEFLKFNNNGTLSTVSKKNPIQGSWKAPAVDKTDNCYHLKFRFTRELYNGVDCWGVYVYDFNTNNGDLIYTCHWATSNADAFPDGIKGITFGAYRNGVSVNAGDDMSVCVGEPLLETDINNLKTSPIYNSGDGAQPDIEEITVIYDENINEGLFTSSTISLINGDKTIPFEYTVLPEERALKIKPADYLEYGTRYVVSVNHPLVSESEFTTAARPITITGVSLSGTTATVTTTGEATTGVCTVILGMYKADGSIIGYKQKPLGSSITFTDLDTDTASVKVFAFEQQTEFARKATEVFIHNCTQE